MSPIVHKHVRMTGEERVPSPRHMLHSSGALQCAGEAINRAAVTKGVETRRSVVDEGVPSRGCGCSGRRLRCSRGSLRCRGGSRRERPRRVWRHARRHLTRVPATPSAWRRGRGEWRRSHRGRLKCPKLPGGFSPLLGRKARSLLRNLPSNASLPSKTSLWYLGRVPLSAFPGEASLCRPEPA